MVTRYNTNIYDEAILQRMNKITNQIFKLLPNREEGNDWKTPLQNLILEIAGMDRLFANHIYLLPLLCKLEALLDLTEEQDFFLFRTTIFECLGLMNELKKCL